MDTQERKELLDKLNDKADDARDAIEDAAVDAADEVKDFAGGVADDVEEKRKKYISPAEVRKNKGCIGCGGAGVIMALMTVAALVAVLI
jgi:hypothetical protein